MYSSCTYLYVTYQTIQMFTIALWPFQVFDTSNLILLKCGIDFFGFFINGLTWGIATATCTFITFQWLRYQPNRKGKFVDSIKESQVWKRFWAPRANDVTVSVQNLILYDLWPLKENAGNASLGVGMHVNCTAPDFQIYVSVKILMVNVNTRHFTTKRTCFKNI